MRARGQLNTVELGPLARLFEAEQARREQAAADLLACNWGCGLVFQEGTSKKEKHKHRQVCRRRPVKCENCGETNIKAEDFETHGLESCPARLRPCELCQELMQHEKLAQHHADDCLKRIVPCSHSSGKCTWTGLFEDLQRLPA